MQSLAINWQSFGLVLASLFLFGCLYAGLVRFMARRGADGQTAWMVVGGVAVTLCGAIFVIGLENTLLTVACFAASGLPMVVEYVWRFEAARRADHEQATKQAKDML
jgi:hypothetical protein